MIREVREELQSVVFNHLAKRAARPHDFLLTDELVEGGGTHAISQRSITLLIIA